MNNFKKWFAFAVAVIIIGVGGYSIGQSHGQKMVLSNNEAALYNNAIIANDWWPAGNGFCYHKTKTQYGGYWVLGEISGTKCIDILSKERAWKLEELIKSGKLPSSVTSAK